MGRIMAFKNDRITTAATPDPKLMISMPGIIWLANNTANPVIPHRIKNPFILVSYRPLGHGLKLRQPLGLNLLPFRIEALTSTLHGPPKTYLLTIGVTKRAAVSGTTLKLPATPMKISPVRNVTPKLNASTP